jgi:hypothetical protein
MKAIAETNEKKRKRMMPRSAGSDSSSGASPKYRMVYTPPGGPLRQPQQHQNCDCHPQFQPWQFQQQPQQQQQQQQLNRALLHRRSRLPLGDHSNFLPATFHASTVGRWATSLKNAACPSKATRRGLQHPWSISKGAIRRVLHHGRVVPTAPPWRRFLWEKKC